MDVEANENQKEFTFGTCEYSYTSPERSQISPTTSVLNVVIPFEDALKLNLAIDECVRKLNRYKKSTTEGKRAALNLAVFLNQGRVSVNETKLKK
jgi:hypothetical protein